MQRIRTWFLVLVLTILSVATVYGVQVHANEQQLAIQTFFGSAATVDIDGNLIVIGNTMPFSTGQSQAFWFKFVSSLPDSIISQRACMRTFGNTEPLDTYGYGIATDSSQNIYVTGATQTFGGEDYDVFLQKYDSSCNLVYTLQWGGSGDDIPRGIAVDSEDNVYVAGTTNSFSSNGQTQIFLLKYDREGELRFSVTWGGIWNDYGAGVAVDPSGNVYVVGTASSYSPAASQVVLLKYDSKGTLLSQRTWGGGTLNSYGTGVAIDDAGYIYVTGYTYALGPTPGVSALILLKFDHSGNMILQKIWGGIKDDFGTAIAVDLDGNVYVAGYTKSYSVSPNIPSALLLKYDPAGNLLFQRVWGGNREDYAYGIAVDNLENVYVTGYTYSFGPNSQGASFFILKYGISGDLQYEKLYGGGTPDP
jgi:hypothetical protein